LQTVVSAMVRKLVMIVGSGMGLGIDDHRRLFRRRVERGFDRLGLGRGRQLPKPLATTTKAIPTGDDAELFLGGPELLADGDRLSPSSRSALALTSRSVRYGTMSPFQVVKSGAQCARRAHGSTKLTGAGRLWTTCSLPLTSITAQAACMPTILPPERRQSRPAPLR
jgi:hypothetical protein